MERTYKNLTKYWIYFFVSLVLMLLLAFSPWGQWFWLILPAVCTSFALAMDIL